MISGKTWVYLEVPKTGSTSVRRALDPYKTDALAQHITPPEAGKRFNYDLIHTCCVRNTYERAVSIWAHMTRASRPHNVFAEWLKRFDNLQRPQTAVMKKPQLFWAKHCHFIMNFETLEEDFHEFCRRADLPEIELPKLNLGQYHGNRDYRQHYNDEAFEIVERIWSTDIEIFGHKFDGTDIEIFGHKFDG